MSSLNQDWLNSDSETTNPHAGGGIRPRIRPFGVVVEDGDLKSETRFEYTLGNYKTASGLPFYARVSIDPIWVNQDGIWLGRNGVLAKVGRGWAATPLNMRPPPEVNLHIGVGWGHSLDFVLGVALCVVHDVERLIATLLTALYCEVDKEGALPGGACTDRGPQPHRAGYIQFTCEVLRHSLSEMAHGRVAFGDNAGYPLARNPTHGTVTLDEGFGCLEPIAGDDIRASPYGLTGHYLIGRSTVEDSVLHSMTQFVTVMQGELTEQELSLIAQIRAALKSRGDTATRDVPPVVHFVPGGRGRQSANAARTRRAPGNPGRG